MTKFLKPSAFLLLSLFVALFSGCDIFNTLSSAQPEISLVDTKSTSSTSGPMQRKGRIARKSLPPVGTCIPFKELLMHGTHIIVYVDKEHGSSSASGESWEKAVDSVNLALNIILGQRQKDSASAAADRRAIIAIAGGNYDLDHEARADKTFGRSIGENGEIISFSGYDTQLFNNLEFLGGFKSGDECKIVELNRGYDANDSERETILDGQNRSNHIVAMTVDNIEDITFSHLTLREGNAAASQGGAMFIGANAYNININHVNFENSTSQQDGGCLRIGNSANDIRLNDVSFTECVAHNVEGLALAILDDAKNVFINGFNVSENRNTLDLAEDGAAILVKGKASNIRFENGEISNNAPRGVRLLGYGGNLGNIYFTNVVIKNHSSDVLNLSGMGILANDVNALSLNNVTFEDNHANAGKGGAVSLENTHFLVHEKITYKNNSANQEGGGLYYAANTKTVNMNNVVCENNFSDTSGGCIAIEQGGKLSITGEESQFIKNGQDKDGNVKTQNGGAIFFAGSHLFLDEKVIFQENKSTLSAGAAYFTITSTQKNEVKAKFINNESGGNGGALFFGSSNIPDIFFYKSRFFQNKAQNGGAFYAQSALALRLKNTDFSSNEASLNGGAMYFDKGWERLLSEHDDPSQGFVGARKEANHPNCKAPVFYIENKMVANKAMGGDGGAIYVAQGNINGTILSSAVNLHCSHKIKTKGKIALSRTAFINFENNSAHNNGGAIAFNQAVRFDTNPTTITLSGNFINNVAQNENGGALYFAGDIDAHNGLYLTLSTFTQNQARLNGGAVHVQGSINKQLQIDSTNFRANKALQENGGAFCLAGDVSNTGSLYMSADSEGNTSGGFGGAFYFQGDVKDTALSGRHGNNSSLQDGGVFYFTKAIKGNISVSGSYTSNKAQNGGAFYLLGADNLIINGSNYFASNEAQKNGGVFYVAHLTGDLTMHFDESLSKIYKNVWLRLFGNQTQTLKDQNILELKNYDQVKKIEDDATRGIVQSKIADYIDRIKAQYFTQKMSKEGTDSIESLVGITEDADYFRLNTNDTNVTNTIKTLYEKEYYKNKIEKMGLSWNDIPKDPTWIDQAFIDSSFLPSEVKRKFKRNLNQIKVLMEDYASKFMTDTEGNPSTFFDEATNQFLVLKVLVEGDNEAVENRKDFFDVETIKKYFSAHDLEALKEFIEKGNNTGLGKKFTDDSEKYFSHNNESKLLWHNNKAVDGGALFLDQVDGTIDISNNIFVSNQSMQNAGVLYSNNVGKFKVSETLLYNNSAKNSGGSFYIGSVNNVDFLGTRTLVGPAEYDAPYFAFGAYEGKTLEDIEIGTKAGQITFDQLALPVGRYISSLGVFDNKMSSYAQYARGMFLFENNQASEYGGVAAFGTINGDLSFNDMSLANNVAKTGGAIYVDEMNGEVIYDQNNSIIYSQQNLRGFNKNADESGIFIENEPAKSMPARFE